MAKVRRTLLIVAAVWLSAAAWAQNAAGPLEPVPIPGSRQIVDPVPQAPASEAAALYRKLRAVNLDAARVFKVRDVSFEREDINFSLDEGTVAFFEDVDGHVTGAFFEGEGEVLLLPPDRAERRSLALFTGAAILEEKFTNAFFRFNDKTFDELRPMLRPTDAGPQFLQTWASTARGMCESDALRLWISYMNAGAINDDRFFRARLLSPKLGAIDVVYDSLSPEQISVGALAYGNGLAFYDVWLSFAGRAARNAVRAKSTPVQPDISFRERFHISRYQIRSVVTPPTNLDCDATLDIEVRQGGERVALFEMSRFLKVRSVEMGGKPLDFLQNEALEGTALSRRGNDVVAVVFPDPVKTGQRLTLRFQYGGGVMSEAGGGLVYVGARGIWYPNRGLVPADFDLEFRYPAPWMLVATGKRVSHGKEELDQVARWVSEKPIPLAGFNLGQYSRATAKAGNVVIEAYGTPGMERTFQQRARVVAPAHAGIMGPEGVRGALPVLDIPTAPAPAYAAQGVADRTARAMDFFSKRLGPYPYSSLMLSQMPGRASQGWPGLVFMSSYVFLTPQELRQANMDEYSTLLYQKLMAAHETAHQWWGDAVGWRSYRDQWLVEALANYCALLSMEKSDPSAFKAVMDHYRHELLEKNQAELATMDAGPVTLGVRLSSSKFPEGFEAISYGRGTWLFHMLRSMLNSVPRGAAAKDDGEPFFAALRRLRERFEGKQMSNADVQRVFEEDLPEPLRYEGKKSLDWFFQTWVNGTAVPKYEVSEVKFARKATGMVASGKLLQKQAQGTLITSVPIYASVAGKMSPVGRVFADGPETTFRLPVPPGTKKLIVDPFQTLLARE